ncbi:MAG: hypothetical protein KAY24_05495, partial [Candidatus Eisenbacteria sp.]|nr:hypothetical protein [Candidatus Eisenbacteria bacterium]
EDMPYEADDSIPCPGATYPPIAEISAVHDVGSSVSQIKQAIYDHGPVSATMMVYDDLVPYEGGCYEHACYGELNHAITLVGWDDSYCGGQGAWIMRNSWGTDWGMGGYAYIQYDAACIGGYPTYVDYLPVTNLLGINHQPLEDTENTAEPYEAFVEIISTGGSVDLGASFMAYCINFGEWITVAFESAGGQDEYVAYIPAQPAGTCVSYYLHAEDTVGNSKTVPMWAPEEIYAFIVGTVEPILFDDFEVASGWTAGAPGDNATSGIWERADPEHTSSSGRTVQPEDDHTPAPGHYCFVTDGRAGSGAGSYDVDGGRTTLLSPVYDLSAYALVVVDYRRWYTNRRGANPYEDIWEVSVRSGASDWVAIEYTTICRENWSHQIHVLNNFTELGPEVQLRFVASDEGEGSLVEALVDDFEMRGVLQSFSDIPDAGREPLAQVRAVSLTVSPSPFAARTSVSFCLPSAGPAQLKVLDCAGRQVRLLHAGLMPAGWHHLVWDGRDSHLRALPSGSYYLQVTAQGSSATRGLLLLR